MTAVAKCPTCEAPITPTDRFCGACGADLTTQAKAAPKRTMLGLVPEPGREATGTPRTPQPATVQAPPPGPKKAPQATMLGIAPPDASAVAAAKAANAPAKGPANAKSTMLGVAPAAAHGAGKAKNTLPGTAKPKKAAIPAVSDRTILGMSAASSASTDSESEGVDDDADYEAPAPHKAPAWRRWALIGGGVLLVLGAVALFSGRAPGLDVRVVAGDAGDALEIRLPDAPAGSKVRFGGKESPIVQGVARVDLAHDALRLGKNELSLSVMDPSGKAREQSFSLEVDYRARFELQHLADAVPAAELVLDVLPGSRVSVDGKAATPDAQGHLVQRIAVAPGGATPRQLVSRYRVEAAGKAAVDAELKATLPAASLLLESPSDGLVTEQARVSVSGSAGADSHVTVNDADAPLKNGHFQYTLPLEAAGEHSIRVVARSAGKAPRAVTLAVKRVTSLSQAAASFEADPSVTYQALAQDPTAQRGKNVAFEGRVYNVEVQGGRTVLQLLVSDCPRGQRCPLWVELGELSDTGKDASVRVLGHVLGEQQFRSKQGAVQAVPSVQAEFVLQRAAR